MYVGHGHGEVQEDLGGGQDHRTVGVLQPVLQQVHDVEDLLLCEGRSNIRRIIPPWRKKVDREKEECIEDPLLAQMAAGTAGLCGGLLEA